MQNPENGGGGVSADNTVPIIDVSNASRKVGLVCFTMRKGISIRLTVMDILHTRDSSLGFVNVSSPVVGKGEKVACTDGQSLAEVVKS